jgi:hypothetical protein
MKQKQTILWVLTFAIALVLGWSFRRPKLVAVEAPPVASLFDQQAPPSALPASRPRDVQSRPEGEGPRGSRRLERRSSAEGDRAVRLGLVAPAKPQEVFMSGRRTLRWLPEIFALPEDADVRAADVVERSNGFVFVRVESGGEAPNGSMLTVFESRTGRLLVVTGKLSVLLKASASGPTLSQEYSMDLVRSIARLNTAIFKSSQPTVAKLTELLEALSRDERVVKAELELIGERVTAQ